MISFFGLLVNGLEVSICDADVFVDVKVNWDTLLVPKFAGCTLQLITMPFLEQRIGLIT